MGRCGMGVGGASSFLLFLSFPVGGVSGWGVLGGGGD